MCLINFGKKLKMNEYIILYCRRDNIWLVARKTARTYYIYKTIAECFTEKSAEILYKELSKKC